MLNTIKFADMELEDLKIEDQKEFLKAFAANPIVRKMEQTRYEWQRKGAYIQAMQVAAKIEEIKGKVFKEFIHDLDRSAERVNLYDTKMTKEQRDEMNTLCVTMFMAADIIDTAVVKMKNVVREIDPTMELVMFDDLKAVIDKARKTVKFMNSASDVAQNVVWEDTSDNMFEMIKNKAKSVVRKRDEAGKEWTKKFDEIRKS